MKRYIIIAAALLLAFAAGAQELEITEEMASSNEVQIDSSLNGMNIWQTLPDNVTISESSKVRNAVNIQVENNARKQFTGFRIRIYFDNAQNAREQSLAIMRKFREVHPELPAFRTYDAPNFKVTVGNFRNRTDAEAALTQLQLEYPSAFIVREKFKYPSVGRFNTQESAL